MAIIVSPFDYKGKLVYFIYKAFAYVILFVSRAKLKIEGRENIDKNERYLFVSNHQSYLDIPVLMVAVPNNMRFVYKRSLSWVPFWGWSMYLNRFIPVNRENPLSAIKSLKQAARILKNKFSINIFPEGTRSIDGNVSEFKRGFFLIASESGKKVVPVSIKGTRNILAKKSYNISGGVVNIKFSNPVDFDSKDKLFAQKIREIISSNL